MTFFNWSKTVTDFQYMYWFCVHPMKLYEMNPLHFICNVFFGLIFLVQGYQTRWLQPGHPAPLVQEVAAGKLHCSIMRNTSPCITLFKSNMDNMYLFSLCGISCTMFLKSCRPQISSSWSLYAEKCVIGIYVLKRGLCVCVCYSCGSAGRSGTGSIAVDHVKVKQEPGMEEECGFSGANVKTERGKDGRRSACMVFRLLTNLLVLSRLRSNVLKSLSAFVCIICKIVAQLWWPQISLTQPQFVLCLIGKFPFVAIFWAILFL